MEAIANQELLNGIIVMKTIPPESYLPSQRCRCFLCTTTIPKCIATKAPTWCSILRVALYCLSILDYPKNVKAFHKHSAIFGFIHSHWNYFKIGTRGGISWKKACQDALSHNTQLFESGQSIMRKTGYWRLKPCLSPWEYDNVSLFAMENDRMTPKRARGRPRKIKEFEPKESKKWKYKFKEYKCKFKEYGYQANEEYKATYDDRTTQEYEVMKDNIDNREHKSTKDFKDYKDSTANTDCLFSQLSQINTNLMNSIQQYQQSQSLSQSLSTTQTIMKTYPHIQSLSQSPQYSLTPMKGNAYPHSSLTITNTPMKGYPNPTTSNTLSSTKLSPTTTTTTLRGFPTTSTPTLTLTLTPKTYPNCFSILNNSEELNTANAFTPTGSPTAPDGSNAFNTITPTNELKGKGKQTQKRKRKREDDKEQQRSLKQLKEDGILGLQKLISVSNQIKFLSSLQKRIVDEIIHRNSNYFTRHSISFPENTNAVNLIH